MKLTRDRILDAGMAAFGEAGFNGLSMRQVAEKLDVHAGSLYYHVANKDALLALLADRVALGAFDAGTVALDALAPDASWTDRVIAQMTALRISLLAHPGSAELLAASPGALSPGALSIMERLLGTLDAAGVDDDRIVVADALLSYVTGFVLQEHAERRAPQPLPFDATYYERFPQVLGPRPRFTKDEMFRRSLDLLCDAAAARRHTGRIVANPPTAAPAGSPA